MENETRFEKIKKHVRKNKKAYIAGGIGFAVGVATIVTYYAADGRLDNHRTRKARNEADRNFAEVIQKLSFENIMKGRNNTLYQRISIYGNVLGRPGTPVYDLTTGKQYASIKLAAHDLLIPRSKIADAAHGRIPHVNGHEFVIGE